MPVFPIREEHLKGFSALFELSDESLQEMLSAFADVTPTLYFNELASKISPKIHTVSTDDVGAIIGVLDMLNSMRSNTRGRQVHDLAEDVCLGMVQSGLVEEPEFVGENRNRFRDRLIEILSSDLFTVSSQAFSTSMEHERIFDDADIITDIRPVFASDVPDHPTSGLIVHSLRVTYFDQEGTKEFFVALKASDLDYLSALLERAVLRADRLKSVLNAANLRYIEVE